MNPLPLFRLSTLLARDANAEHSRSRSVLAGKRRPTRHGFAACEPRARPAWSFRLAGCTRASRLLVGALVVAGCQDASAPTTRASADSASRSSLLVPGATQDYIVVLQDTERDLLREK